MQASALQIYDPSNTKSTKIMCEELKKIMHRGCKTGRIQVIDRQADISDNPLFVICLNHSRIGTDMNNSLSGLPQTLDWSKVAVCVLHVQAPHALPTTMPTENLTSDEFEKYGKLIDFTMTPDARFYKCDMNKRGHEKLVSFLKVNIDETKNGYEPVDQHGEASGGKGFTNESTDSETSKPVKSKWSYCKDGVTTILGKAKTFFFPSRSQGKESISESTIGQSTGKDEEDGSNNDETSKQQAKQTGGDNDKPDESDNSDVPDNKTKMSDDMDEKDGSNNDETSKQQTKQTGGDNGNTDESDNSDVPDNKKKMSDDTNNRNDTKDSVGSEIQNNKSCDAKDEKDGSNNDETSKQQTKQTGGDNDKTNESDNSDVPDNKTKMSDDMNNRNDTTDSVDSEIQTNKSCDAKDEKDGSNNDETSKQQTKQTGGNNDKPDESDNSDVPDNKTKISDDTKNRYDPK